MISYQITNRYYNIASTVRQFVHVISVLHNLMDARSYPREKLQSQLATASRDCHASLELSNFPSASITRRTSDCHEHIVKYCMKRSFTEPRRRNRSYDWIVHVWFYLFVSVNQNGGCILEESLHSNKRFLMCKRRLSYGEFLMLRPEVTQAITKVTLHKIW